MSSDRVGHVPTIVHDLARVLRAHGFVTINERSIRLLVRDHKEQYVEEQLGDLHRLRQLALQQEDLASIRALLLAQEVSL